MNTPPSPSSSWLRRLAPRLAFAALAFAACAASAAQAYRPHPPRHAHAGHATQGHSHPGGGHSRHAVHRRTATHPNRHHAPSGGAPGVPAHRDHP